MSDVKQEAVRTDTVDFVKRLEVDLKNLPPASLQYVHHYVLQGDFGKAVISWLRAVEVDTLNKKVEYLKKKVDELEKKLA